MPNRRSKKPAEEQAEPWQAASHGRISARAKARQDSVPAPSYYGFEKLATRPLSALATGEPIAPGEEEVRRTGEQTARYHFRTTTAGQMVGAFRRIVTA